MLDIGYEVTMKLTEICAPDFDLAKTLDSGQVFHWEKIGEGFVGVTEDITVYVEQGGDVLKANMEGRTPGTPGSRELVPPVAELVKHYFALDHPLAAICPAFLSRITDHSTTEMGMPGHVHLFLNETSRAHPANFESAAGPFR